MTKKIKCAMGKENKPQDSTCHSTISVWQRENKTTEIKLKVRDHIQKYQALSSEKPKEIQGSSVIVPQDSWHRCSKQLIELCIGFFPLLLTRVRGRRFHIFFYLNTKPLSQNKHLPNCLQHWSYNQSQEMAYGP